MQAHERTRVAPHEAPDSELAQQLVRNPYVVDHLALSGRAAERELEQALMDRLQQTLLEFGHGMAFVGRQVRFDVGAGAGTAAVPRRAAALRCRRAQDRPVRPRLRGPARDLRRGRRRPAAPRRPARPHRGILLCKGRSDTLVRYALAGAPAPLAVADYTYDTLPAHERGGLPTAAELAAALEASVPPAGAGLRQQERPD